MIKPDHAEVMASVAVAIEDGNYVVCYTKCWACIANQCPGGPHGWADADDIDHAAKSGQPDPSGQSCGCPCVKEEPRGPDDIDLIDIEPEEIALFVVPCSECEAVGACAWDSEGRPLIHATTEAGGDE